MVSVCRKSYIITILLIFSAMVPKFTSSRVIPEADRIRERHAQWMNQYQRDYKDDLEKESRFGIFKSNVEYIDFINNAGRKPYKLSVNKFADITKEEFKKTYMAYRSPNSVNSRPATAFWYENFTDIPPSIDWRKKGAVTSIRDETCGAWTFPAVDTVEGIIKIKGGKLYDLSVQEIVDCNTGFEEGCDGGFVSDAFEFIKDNGITTEKNYPPRDKKGTCDKKKEAEPVTKIIGYQKVPANNEEALMQAVANQPVAVTVDASGYDFQFYSTGVFTGQCGDSLDHGVTVVGYGMENGKLKYWIVKNSWGTSWGEDGYMRLQKDIADKEGLCGIAIEVYYPLI